MAVATTLKTWAREVRAPFLLLSVVLVPVGALAAWWETGGFHLGRFIWTLIGLILAHIAVNVFNEYFDYKSGIDLKTKRTPFSGGSGVLPAGLLRPEAVYKLGLATMFAAFAIGLYLTAVSGPLLLPIIFAGGAAIYLYTTHFARWGIGEVVAGLGLGTLPVLGAYFVQASQFTVSAAVAAIAPGFLTANLLLLNEFPDVEADRAGGRRHLVIILGRKGAAYVYVAWLLGAYLTVLGGVIGGVLPVWCLIALLTLPMAFKAARTALKEHDDLQRLVPGLAANVQVVLGTDLLLALGFLIARLLR